MTDRCLYPLPRGGLCERRITRIFAADHCHQHGGLSEASSSPVRAWLEGESVLSIAARLERPVERVESYIRRYLRRAWVIARGEVPHG